MIVPGEPTLSPALLLRMMLPRHRASPAEIRKIIGADNRNLSLLRLGRDGLAVSSSLFPEGPFLVPAYICDDAVEGIRAAGRDVVYYRLGPDLNPLWHSLPAVRSVLLLVHYFGFPADAAAASRWCTENHARLVEDCAHSFLSRGADGRRLGLTGDCSIYSFRKHIPVATGAAVVSPAGLQVDMKSGIAGAGLLSLLRQTATWALFNSGSSQAVRLLAPFLSDERGLAVSRGRRFRKMDQSTRCVISALADQFELISERRRSNFLSLSEALSGLDEVRPVVPGLPDGTAPWAYPVKVASGDARSSLIETLLQEGIGAWTWPSLPEDISPESFPFEWELAQTTLLLPVHQDLDESHMRRVSDTVAGWALTR